MRTNSLVGGRVKRSPRVSPGRHRPAPSMVSVAVLAAATCGTITASMYVASAPLADGRDVAGFALGMIASVLMAGHTAMTALRRDVAIGEQWARERRLSGELPGGGTSERSPGKDQLVTHRPLRKGGPV